MANETEKNERKDERSAKGKATFEELRAMCKGTFRLAKPLRAASQDVKELQYDFCALTGEELLNALDDAGSYNLFNITNRQALNIFARTAANCTVFIGSDNQERHFLPNEIINGLCSVDVIKAAQLAKLFYNASTRVEAESPDKHSADGK